MAVRVVELDAAGWKTPLDFLAALKSALNAPEWCGSSPAAIDELMVWGLGGLPPPYIVQISGAAKAPEEVRDYIALISDCIRSSCEEYRERKGEDIDVSIKY